MVVVACWNIVSISLLSEKEGKGEGIKRSFERWREHEERERRGGEKRGKEEKGERRGERLRQMHIPSAKMMPKSHFHFGITFV